MMVKLAIKHNLYLISDEVYREFVYDSQDYLSPAQYQELAQHFILIDSISKRYSACGARIGFIVSKNKTLMNQLKKAGPDAVVGLHRGSDRGSFAAETGWPFF